VTRAGGLIGVLVFGCLFPIVFSGGDVLNIAVLTLMYASLASSWNILGGFAGYMSLGAAAFFGIGAYSLGLIVDHVVKVTGYTVFALVPVAGLIAAVLAIPLGWAALRTRHAVFAIVTIAMMFVVQHLALNLPGVTGGASGLGLPIPPWTGNFFDVPFYYAMLVLVVVTVAICWAVRRSGLGLGLLSIRDDEDKAEAIGVPTKQYKLIAFVVSAGLTGMAGAVYAFYVAYIYPQFAVDPLISVGVALMAFLGGAGTLTGPLLGAIILEPAQIELGYHTNGQLYLILYGGLFLAVILLMPRGIIPSVSDRIASRRERRNPMRIGTPASARAAIR